MLMLPAYGENAPPWVGLDRFLRSMHAVVSFLKIRVLRLNGDCKLLSCPPLVCFIQPWVRYNSRANTWHRSGSLLQKAPQTLLTLKLFSLKMLICPGILTWKGNTELLENNSQTQCDWVIQLSVAKNFLKFHTKCCDWFCCHGNDPPFHKSCWIWAYTLTLYGFIFKLQNWLL